MAQQNDPQLNEAEQALLSEAPGAYALSDLYDALASRDAWDRRIQIAFSSAGSRFSAAWAPK